MRILHTISVKWWNACAYYAISLARNQLDRGDEVFIASVPGYLSTDVAAERHIPIIEINFATINPVQWIMERSKLRSFLIQNELDVINCHTAEDHLMCAALKPRKSIPLIRTVGDVRTPHKNFFNSRLFKKHTSFFIFSCYANFLRYNSIWPGILERYTLIHGGIDTTEFIPRSKNFELYRRLSLPEDSLIVGNIGRFSKTKDHFTFLQAAVLALHKIKLQRIHFLISGADAGLKSEDINRMVKNFNLENHVTVSGPVNPVNDLISLLDIGVISSKSSEAICRIAMEYMAMGMPLVVTDVNVLPEIVMGGRNGIIVPPEAPEEMSQAIIQLISDPILRKRMARNNIKDAQDRFSSDEWYTETHAVYNEVIGNGKRSGSNE